MALNIPQCSNGTSSTSVPRSSSSSVLAALPNLMEFLLCVSPEGRLQRAPGSLQVFVEGGKWKARLKDKQERAYCFVSADGLDDLLLLVNEGLGNGCLDWRPDQEGQFQRSRK